MSEKRMVGIVGSREYEHLEHVKGFIVSHLSSKIHRIVSGGARGVDSEAARVGRFLGFEVREHLPTDIVGPDGRTEYAVWKLFARNTLIAKDADELHAFIRFEVRSNGTFDTVFKAAKFGKPITVHYSDGSALDFLFPVPPTKGRLESLVYWWEHGPRG